VFCTFHDIHVPIPIQLQQRNSASAAHVCAADALFLCGSWASCLEHPVESLAYIFVADSMGLSLFKFVQCMGSKRRIFSATACVLAVQGHSMSHKVDDFGINQKRVCDFLLVGLCNNGPILHRFRATATYWLNCLFFPPHSHSAPRSLCSLWNFAVKLTTRKIESSGYPPVKTPWF